MHEPELGCGVCWACARELFINTIQIVNAKIGWIIASTAKGWYNIRKACKVWTPFVLVWSSHAPHLTALFHEYNAIIATHSANTNFIYKRTMLSCVHERINLPCANLETKMTIIISQECLRESWLSYNLDRTHSVFVGTIGDRIIFAYMNPNWVTTPSSFYFFIPHRTLDPEWNADS